MRKSAMICGLGGCLLIASAVWAADGPGMTAGQRISSFFGLVDQAANAPPPPTPPGMPPMNARGPVRVPFSPRSSQPNTAKAVTPPAAQPSAATAAARDPSLPQPPQPLRLDDTSGAARPMTSSSNATAASARVSDTTPNNGAAQAQPRTSIVGASKAPLFMNQPTAKAAANPGGVTTAGASGTSAKAGVPTAAEMSKPFVSSRRRAPSDDAAPTTAAPPSPAAARPTATPSPLDDVQPVPMLPIAGAAATAKSTATPEPIAPPQPIATPTPATSTAARSTPIAEPQLQATRSQPMTLPAPNSTRSSTLASTVPQPIATPTPTSNSSERGEVLATHTNPGLTVETVGPGRAAIGRETSYRVIVQNHGDSEARDVVVTVRLPAQAELTNLQGTAGSSSSPNEQQRGAPLVWKLDALGADATAELKLSLVPRTSESFELGVSCTASAPVSRALVEVEEPRLAMSITGPNEVAFGEQRLYKLTVSNPGTGPAENVVLQLMPLSAGDGDPLRHTIGTIKPGESSVIEVELTARQAGALRIRTEASAEGNLRAEAAADVLVRRAVLEVAVAAPNLLFAGVPGTYEFRVRNTGDDAARNVRMTVDLPSGAKLIDAFPAIRSDSSDRQLTWTIDRIAAAGEQTFTVKCEWDRGGEQQLNASVAADGDLRKAVVAATDVQAVADLALDVVDTPGPVQIGTPVTYEIRVKNRGLKAAEGVDVVAYFSEGIEPERAEGQMHEIQPGVVIFQSLANVGPGQEKVLKVTARAQTSGNHRLRVELHGTSPQTQLSHEDATFFYSDDTTTPQKSTSPGSFEPQGAAPIHPTGAAMRPGATQPVMKAAVPDYRVNKMR